MSAGHMALSFKKRSEEENKFLQKFINKWMADTERFENVISKIQFPTFLKDIDKCCPLFSYEQITFINNVIKKEKCIPSLTYAQKTTFYNSTKQVWWLAPCIYWGNKLVSWIMVDKNGFYAPHPDEWDDQNNISPIFSWEMIEDVSFYMDEDESKNQIAVLNIEATNGSELTFYELLKKDSNPSETSEKTLCRGSFLSVFESIFQVNHKNILESRGTHSWNHGVGMEGFQSFEEPLDLLNISFWENSRNDRYNYKTNELFDFNPDT